MKKWAVYKHVCPDGLVYIGKTSRKPIVRWTQGTKYHANADFYNAILRNGGEENFLSTFMHYVLNIDQITWLPWSQELSYTETNVFNEEDANILEALWIEVLRTTEPQNGYNRTSGGNRGFFISEISRLRNSKSHEGMCIGNENPFWGKKHSIETKQQLSEFAKARTGIANPFFGKKHTEETKEKIRMHRIGCCTATRNPFYGQQHSEVVKWFLSELKQKPISSYTLDGRLVKTYPSCSSAAADMGTTISSISACATGCTKTSCNMLWRYFAVPKLSKEDLPKEHALCKAVSQYDENGHLIKTFFSLKAAASENGITSTAISAAANKRVLQAGGFLWRYYEVEQLSKEEIPQRIGRYRKVGQYNQDGNLIKAFPSIKDAAETVGRTPVAVLRAVQNSGKAAGFFWRYLD